VDRAGEVTETAGVARARSLLRGRLPRQVRHLLVLVLTSSTAGAQAQAFDDNPLPDLFAGLMSLSLSKEVSSGWFRVDNDTAQSDDTRFSTLRVPWSDEFDVGLPLGRLSVELDLGALWADDRLEVDTVLGRAAVDESWSVYGVQGGLGWSLPLSESWRALPTGQVGLAYLRNDASYNAPAATLIKPLIDGDLVNWDAWAVSTTGAFTLERVRDREQLSWGLVGRHAWVETRVIETDSSFHAGRDTSRLGLVRAELGGPSSMHIAGEAVPWSVDVSWIELLDVDRAALGFDSFGQLGAALELPLVRGLPRVRAGTALILGEDIQGWSVGASISL
jgi:hypothetical protein